MTKARSARGDAFGIMNHVGSMWTHDTFPTEEAANKALEDHRAEWKRRGWGDLGKHRVVRVNVTVSPKSEKTP